MLTSFTFSRLYLQTGLDPEVRRLIWDIILAAKQDRTIILTTRKYKHKDNGAQRALTSNCH